MKNTFKRFGSLLVALVLVLAMVGQIPMEASAYDVGNGTKIYFQTDWTNDVIQVMIGHSGWSQGYAMTKVSGTTNIYCVTMPDWGGATDIAVFGADAVWGGEGSSIANRKGWAPISTDVFSLSGNLDASKSYVISSTGIAEMSFTVSFDANGGSGTMADATSNQLEYSLPACTFTAPANKSFAGWATSADGEAITTGSVNCFGGITLYANWTDVPHTHSWATTWESNETHHWHACTGAGTCTATNADAEKAYGEHVWDNIGDAECNTCGQTREVVFVVAGASGLCGSDWNPADTVSNKMTLQADGTYTKTFTNVAAGSYEFKVTNGTDWSAAGHKNWGGALANGNNEVVVSETSDVTIIFNPVGETITTNVTPSGSGGSTPAPTVSYFVAGSESLCGVAWDENAEANKMTESSGVYTKTYNNVPVGDYEFKVTNGTWDDGCSWGKDGQNFKFSVTAACNVTVTFNPNTKEITVTGDNVELPAPPAPGYYVAGNGAAGNSWVNGAAWECDNASNKMTESNGVYTIKYTNVAPGEYEFKVTDGTWNNAWPGENYKFKVTTACDVTVTFNPATGAVSVKGAGIPSADTADSTNLVALTAVLVLSAAGLAVLTKKKEF